MKIAVIGTGYVGLVAGACFARLGHEVTCIDRDADKITALMDGQCPIYEEGLAEILANPAPGSLEYSDNPGRVREAEVVILAVGTPSAADGRCDTSYIEAAARGLRPFLAPDRRTIVAIKSTVPVGTAARVRAILAGTPAAVVSNPEFLREGTAVADFMHAERAVIGSDDPWARATMRQLYAPITRVYEMDNESAELAKYAANGMLALRVSFINEIAQLCEAVGANINHVRDVMASDSRIGPRFLVPGPGWGGSCFGKDVSSLRWQAEDARLALLAVGAIGPSNLAMKRHVVDRLVAELADLRAGATNLDGCQIAVWGLAFKAGTDDVRDSPALDIIRELVGYGARVIGHDPQAGAAAMDTLRSPLFHAAGSPEAALVGADALLVLTGWPEYRAVDPHVIGQRLKTQPALVFDTRGILSRPALEHLGYRVLSVGIPTPTMAAPTAATG